MTSDNSVTPERAFAILIALAEEYDRDHPRGPMVKFAEWLASHELTDEQIEAIGVVMRRRRLLDEEWDEPT